MLKKTIFEYLNIMYPNSYKLITKFGIIHCVNGEFAFFDGMSKDLVTVFGCDKDFIDSTIREWLSFRPTLGPIVNSTIPDVLVHVN